MDDGSCGDAAQSERFKAVARELDLEQHDDESLDRIMDRLDLRRKPEPGKNKPRK